MRIALDESVDIIIEKKLNGRDIETVRPEEGASDQEVIEYCIENDTPLLTRDPSDFVELHRRIGQHPGILIDKEMHLRDRSLVADTVKDMLNEIGDELENNVWWVSEFYGREY